MNSGHGTMDSVLGDGRRALSEEVPVGCKRTEVGVIPEEWNTHPLRDDISLLSGHHVLAHNCNIRGDGTPYVTGPADFPDGRIKQTKFTTKPTTICRAGDILVTVKGSGSGTLVEADTEYCISRQLMAIRTTAWNPTFLLYSLLQNASRIKAASTGLIPGLSRSDILDQTIPLPNDTAEQRAITEALSDVDKLLGSLEALIAKKRTIKQAAMQQLLTGKTRLPGFGGAWETKQLEHLVDCLDHVRIPLNEAQRSNMPGPYPYCGANGVLDYVNNFILDDDVILIAEDGGYFDEYAHRPIAYRMSGKIWVNNHAHILKAKRGYSQGFLYFSLAHKNVLPYLASGTRAKLNKSELNRIEIYLPLQNGEQRAIATVLSDMDSEIVSLERRRDKTRAIKQGMMQQLLTGRVRLVSDQEVNDYGP